VTSCRAASTWTRSVSAMASSVQDAGEADGQRGYRLPGVPEEDHAHRGDGLRQDADAASDLVPNSVASHDPEERVSANAL